MLNNPETPLRSILNRDDGFERLGAKKSQVYSRKKPFISFWEDLPIKLSMKQSEKKINVSKILSKLVRILFFNNNFVKYKSSPPFLEHNGINNRLFSSKIQCSKLMRFWIYRNRKILLSLTKIHFFARFSPSYKATLCITFKFENLSGSLF